MAKQSKLAMDITKQQDAQTKMLSGSAWMTAGSIFSRILGAIYIIPWVTWLGNYSDQANALYAKGYNIYSFFLMAAVAGVPSAVSKLVSHYNAMNEYGVGRRLYHHGMYVSALTGFVAAVILYFGAPLFADGDANVIPVLRSLTLAILVIPSMSLVRGFFQGYQQMAPSAISQFVEQVFRVVYMLAATFFIMRVQHGSWVNAVSQSTFAAFIGSLGSILLLAYYYLRNKESMDELVAQSDNQLVVSSWSLIKDIIIQAIPFIIVSSGTIIFQLIDQYTFFNVMRQLHEYTMAEMNQLYALFSFNANKLMMVVISLASALSITVIPMLSAAKTKDDITGIRQQTSNALLLFYFVMLPASLGLAAVAKPLYTIFYRYSASGTTVLIISAYIAIILGLYTVVSAIMQGLSQNVRTLKYLGIGIVVKLVLQVPAILLLKTIGPLIATGMAMTVTVYLIIHSLNVEYRLPFKKMAKSTNQILLFSIITFVVARLVVDVLYLFFSDYGRGSAFFVLLVAVLFGGGVYAVLALKTRLADRLIGNRVAGIRRRLHIK
ncbi:MOP superfamilymultidrug/oligosaccharidyl-lipid/ polysaccharide flippase transporter [Paucilactobacillus hokkaidonensis JCM 18461]|uniref:MOP superfamilymultidrug/oligosaccharidyl-lipid/ polysaccharide flippase transporter n=2 Tax=Paucilactobacillus hokkaidonensis TaxID=1193095 RepID=A0A0A1GTN7_9LACO|nr:polysaccharide biosynthesis protein [Paucilactobacillus hokkaidonensis]KRO10123.1 MOP superfamily multidrug oligosaccharidyl-lipid polysaccharide flippase transporter [Paucilactobacillus hokkaidonensis]BAP85365.1 MOP superfamilymultidrug/oligosaccharidyl-lipid/ polysaccharide flippase transporter [Paucilactobacillus hokkaidonensis JCM 18461]